MGEPFLGEIRVFPYTFVPRSWAACDGQLLPINQNQALFSLLGTTYGGNGQTTFALPNLQGKVPMHLFPGTSQPGQTGGETAHSLSVAEMAAHFHGVVASNTQADQALPGGNVLANVGLNAYAAFDSAQPLAPDSITNAGGSLAHENRSPFLAFTIAIALAGAFPSRN